MTTRVRALRLLGVLLSFSGVLACSEGTPPLAWQFRFITRAQRMRANVVLAQIREGGCDGRTVFASVVSRDGTPATPPELPDGRYGFAGRARDLDCEIFAEGCVEAELPQRNGIVVELQPLAPTVLDTSCVESPDDDSATAGDGDGDGDSPSGDGDVGPSEDGGLAGDGDTAGDGDGDAEPVVDAGEDQPSPADDAGSDEPDAAPPPPPVTSVCDDLDDAVSACYDFNGNLDDASGQGNHASGNATFETGLMGQALRPDGQAIFVEDDGTLRFAEFTLEAWFKPDALLSLSGDDSLIIDKDQQYILGMNREGDPFGEVYRAQNDSEKTTAAAGNLTVGTWAYVAYTFDGSRARVYKDGVLVDEESVAIVPFVGVGGRMHIGTGSPAATRPFDGLIDAVRISGVTRSAEEICVSAGKEFALGSCN